jgi:Rps23 Pro-64 3,4-dihydroxylase Tpa1-like proline 4-hydroxylase
MLNPALDIAALARAYKAKNRILIRDVLQTAPAEDLYNVLSRETPWKLVYYDRDKTVVLSPEDMQRLTPQDRAQRISSVYAHARGHFGFIYQAFLMAENYAQKNYPGHPLHAVFAFINSAPFIELVRKVSGISTIAGADGQATLYVPGHFLNTHNDRIAGHKRRVAYVLNMAKDWDPDWGGLLQFYGAEKSVDQVFVPRFNSLSLFTVPQEHAVTAIAPYAPVGRFAITGWFVDQ